MCITFLKLEWPKENYWFTSFTIQHLLRKRNIGVLVVIFYNNLIFHYLLSMNYFNIDFFHLIYNFNIKEENKNFKNHYNSVLYLKKLIVIF
jgi:hypothetical protein